MTTRIVVKKGQDSWSDLVGKEISFDWFDGYEDFPYEIEGEFEGTVDRGPEYRGYYYIMVDGGGCAVHEDEEVKVTVYD